MLSALGSVFILKSHTLCGILLWSFTIDSEPSLESPPSETKPYLVPLASAINGQNLWELLCHVHPDGIK